jgi:hypothetical protein
VNATENTSPSLSTEIIVSNFYCLFSFGDTASRKRNRGSLKQIGAAIFRLNGCSIQGFLGRQSTPSHAGPPTKNFSTPFSSARRARLPAAVGIVGVAPPCLSIDLYPRIFCRDFQIEAKSTITTTTAYGSILDITNALDAKD